MLVPLRSIFTSYLKTTILLRKIFGLPFSWLWDLSTRIRNYLFDQEILSSQGFDLPLIGVGNLSMGGSGKTPHVEYLLQLLQQEYHLAVLSRGYKRKTSGYVFATAQSTVAQIGDEPLQYKLKFPHVAVAVSESRVLGVPQLLMDAPQTEVIILDDVFQHRAIAPGLNILLTDYRCIYPEDMIFPAGNLREAKSGADRAEIIIVTKCPANLTKEEAEVIRDKMAIKMHQTLYFSTYHYAQPYSFYNGNDRLIDTEQEVLLVTGIAKPDYLEAYLKDGYDQVYTNAFPDHYQFTNEDINRIAQTYGNLDGPKKIIMVTEKDAVKLNAFRKQITERQLPIYIQPIEVKLLFDQGAELNQEVLTFVENFYNVGS